MSSAPSISVSEMGASEVRAVCRSKARKVQKTARMQAFLLVTSLVPSSDEAVQDGVWLCLKFRVPSTPRSANGMAIEIRVSNHRKVEPIFALRDLLNHVYKHTYNPG